MVASGTILPSMAAGLVVARGGMFSVRLCIDEAGKSCEIGIDQVRAVLENPDYLVWIDVDRDHLNALEPYQDLIPIHPLAREDATSPQQRPILSKYGETLFLVMYEMIHEDDHITPYPIALFVGRNYVVSVRDVERSTLDDVATRWREYDKAVKTRTPGFLLYAILDEIVDDYFPVVDTLGERVEALEDEIILTRRDHIQQQIHTFRKELFAVRRAIGPEREVLNGLVHRDTPLIDEEAVDFVQDVYDHLLRVLDWLDAYRDMASNLFDMQLAMASHRLDQVMRTLTVASIMLMVASLIAGIYGMNFEHMPELHWLFGYPMALALMIALMTMLFLFFKRRNWV
jgi:magnesium transporter